MQNTNRTDRIDKVAISAENNFTTEAVIKPANTDINI
jgi:hypothetical protein